MNSVSNKRRNDRSVESFNAFKAVDNDSNTADITLRHNFNRSILDLDLKPVNSEEQTYSGSSKIKTQLGFEKNSKFTNSNFEQKNESMQRTSTLTMMFIIYLNNIFKKT